MLPQGNLLEFLADALGNNSRLIGGLYVQRSLSSALTFDGARFERRYSIAPLLDGARRAPKSSSENS
jgi:hypothetical protein